MPILTPLQVEKLSELAAKGRIAPLYLFIGPYPLIEDKAKRIYEVLLAQGSQLEVFDLRSPEGKKDFSSVKGYQEGLFGLRKVYLLYGAEGISPPKAKEMIDTFSRYEKLPFSWFLLSDNFPESHPLYHYANEKGAIVPYPIRRKEDLLEMELSLELKKNNISMSKEVMTLFLSFVGDDFHHFKNELQKLILYLEGKSEVTEDDVLNLIVPSPSSAIFLVGDTLFHQGPPQAFKIIENLLDSKYEPAAILNYLYRYFKRMELFREFLQENPELERENQYSVFAKKLQALKSNPAGNIPQSLADSHPYSLITIKSHLRKIKDFVPFYQALLQAEISLKRDFRNPKEVFSKLLFDLWEAIG